MNKRTGWDDHTPSAPRQSAQWAATARGWYFVGGEARGNYLDYGPFWPAAKVEREGGAIHAVRGDEARCFPSVEAAKSWIEVRP